MHLVGVYGASGFGREVMPLVREQFADECHEHVFIDDSAQDGQSICEFAEFNLRPADLKTVVIAIADSKIRERLADKCAQAGLIIAPIVKAASSVILDNVDIAPGAILCPFTTLTSDIRIGMFFHANIYSYVAHDCVIGDLVTFAPGVKCNGNVVIEDHVYVGTGAIIKQGKPGKPLRIGRGAVIGMGAVVTKDVPAGAVVVGNPARPMLPRAD